MTDRMVIVPEQAQRSRLAWTRLTGRAAQERAIVPPTRRHRNRLREQRMGRARHAGRNLHPGATDE